MTLGKGRRRNINWSVLHPSKKPGHHFVFLFLSSFRRELANGKSEGTSSEGGRYGHVAMVPNSVRGETDQKKGPSYNGKNAELGWTGTFFRVA